MIDVHCHLNFKAFANDYDEVIKRAVDAGISTIINVGTQVSSSGRAVELAKQYDNLYAIVGVHPHHADKALLQRHAELDSASLKIPKQVRDDNIDWLAQLGELAKQPKVVAIGEIGLDNYRYQSNGIVDPKTQQEIFIAQINLAHRLHLPLQIHNRHAGKEILEILYAHRDLLQDSPGMFHCMSGDVAFLRKVLDLGFYVGFDGNSTYKGIAPGEDTPLSDLISYAPLDRIVTETDSPYLTPEPHRGSRNEPAYGILVGHHIAKIKGVAFEEVASRTSGNAKKLFDIS